MTSIFNWMRECFNYFVFGQMAEELIVKINDVKNEIPNEVKEDLIASIMLNKPSQLMNQLNDMNNHMPTAIREDLIASVMMAKAPQPATVPVVAVEVDTQTDEVIHIGKIIPSDQFVPRKSHHKPRSKSVPASRVVEHNPDDVIYISKIIPSDQFVPVSRHREVAPLPHPRPYMFDWDRNLERITEHSRLQMFITYSRQELQREVKKKFSSVLEELVSVVPMVSVFDPWTDWDEETVPILRPVMNPTKSKNNLVFRRHQQQLSQRLNHKQQVDKHSRRNTVIFRDGKWNQHF